MREEQLKDGVDRVVERLVAAMEIECPPIDALEVARRLGMEIRLDARQEQRGRLVRGRIQPTICLRSEPRLERRHWTVAHEVGEHLMSRLLSVRELPGTDDGERFREDLANRFAKALLVPLRWFARDSRELHGDLIALKQRYRTASYEVLALRLLDLPEPTVLSVFDNGVLSRRRGNVPNWPTHLLELEARAQASANLNGAAVELRDAGSVVQAWPIHEPGWRREIVRLRLAAELVEAA